MCTVTESPSVSSSLTLLSLPAAVVAAPIAVVTSSQSLRTMLGCSGAVGRTAAAAAAFAASTVRRLPRKKRPVAVHGCCGSAEPRPEPLPFSEEVPQQYPRTVKRSRTGAIPGRSHLPTPTGSSALIQKKSVRICEASNQVHVLDASQEGDCDSDTTTRWYQPTDYAQFRAAAIKQLSVWMSSSDSKNDDKGSALIPRGLEPLYHRAVLQSSKQRQMYASLIVWKHRVLVHRRQQQQQQQQQQQKQAEQHHDAKDSEGAPTSVEDAVRELSEPLTEPDRIRAYRMAAMTTTATTSAASTASVVVRGSCSVERR
jgi:hypothetical protein